MLTRVQSHFHGQSPGGEEAAVLLTLRPHESPILDQETEGLLDEDAELGAGVPFLHHDHHWSSITRGYRPGVSPTYRGLGVSLTVMGLVGRPGQLAGGTMTRGIRRAEI
jgi:hypothetical protein